LNKKLINSTYNKPKINLINTKISKDNSTVGQNLKNSTSPPKLIADQYSINKENYIDPLKSKSDSFTNKTSSQNNNNFNPNNELINKTVKSNYVLINKSKDNKIKINGSSDKIDSQFNSDKLIQSNLSPQFEKNAINIQNNINYNPLTSNQEPNFKNPQTIHKTMLLTTENIIDKKNLNKNNSNINSVDIISQSNNNKYHNDHNIKNQLSLNVFLYFY